MKKALGSPNLTVETLDSLMTNFVETAENGTHLEHGWPSAAYFVSKIGWSALSRLQTLNCVCSNIFLIILLRIHQRMMAADSRADIVVNHVHPGYVDTDMTSHKGPLTIDR